MEEVLYTPPLMLLFPVRVNREPNERLGLKTCMVQAEHGQVRIWRAEPAQQPAVVHEAAGQLVPFADKPTGYTIEWADGSPAWQILPEGGCGCSHSLKRFQPAPIPAPTDGNV